MDEAIAFYKKCAPVIKNGRNYRFGPYQNSYNDLKGWQAVVRVSEDGKSLVAVVNTFAMNGETSVEFKLPSIAGLKKQGLALTKCLDSFKRNGINVDITKGKVVITNLSDYDGLVLKL